MTSRVGALAADPAGGASLAGAPGVDRFEETLVLNVRFESTGAAVDSFSVKAQQFRRVSDAAPSPAAPSVARSATGAGAEQFSYELVDARGDVLYRHSFEAPAICLVHPPGDPPHVAGDVVVPHSASFLLKVPYVPGARAVRIVRPGVVPAAGQRLTVSPQHALLELDATKFTGSRDEYDRHFGLPSAPPP
ncbi:MAG: hypothetical protein ACREQL_11560 [Candidatus Binatia bacterium]